MKNYRRKRIVVTGGAGFLGSHLCERLLTEGCEVFGLDNYCLGDNENLRDLMSDPKFDVIHHDVTVLVCMRIQIMCSLESGRCARVAMHCDNDWQRHRAVAVVGRRVNKKFPFNAVVVQRAMMHGLCLANPGHKVSDAIVTCAEARDRRRK